MKLIVTVLIACFFTLIGLMKLEGYFDLGIIKLIDLDGMFEVDLSFIKYTIDYIFYIPELLLNSEKSAIKEYFSTHSTLTDKNIYLSIVFLFHFIFIGIIFLLLKLFPSHKDRQFLTIFIIITYLVIIYFIKK